jgi:hypothetical protein
MSERRSDRRRDENESRDEYRAPSTEVVVQWVGEPAAAVKRQSVVSFIWREWEARRRTRRQTRCKVRR